VVRLPRLVRDVCVYIHNEGRLDSDAHFVHTAMNLTGRSSTLDRGPASAQAAYLAFTDPVWQPPRMSFDESRWFDPL